MKSDNNLTKALSLQKQTADNGESGKRSGHRAAQPDIGELFLAELSVRRANLRRLIELVNQQVEREAALAGSPVAHRVSSSCRSRQAQRIWAQV